MYLYLDWWVKGKEMMMLNITGSERGDNAIDTEEIKNNVKIQWISFFKWM